MQDVTSDLSKFGMKELAELRDLLNAWLEHGLPNDFEDDGVFPMFNPNSGCVFLTNAEYQSAMLNDDKLESWYNCPCGHEAFFENIEHEPIDTDCTDFLKSVKKARQ